MNYRLRPIAIVAFFVLFLSSVAALADGGHDRTQFGSDINIGPNDEAGDVTCFFCSVRVHGHTNGDVTVFFGSIVVEDQAEVSGDVTDFGSGIRLSREAKVDGDVTTFGGQVRHDSAASIGGEITTFSGSIWLFLIFGLPLVVFGAFVALIVWGVRKLTRPSLPVTA
jgi:hypothetical protein